MALTYIKFNVLIYGCVMKLYEMYIRLILIIPRDYFDVIQFNSCALSVSLKAFHEIKYQKRSKTFYYSTIRNSKRNIFSKHIHLKKLKIDDALTEKKNSTSSNNATPRFLNQHSEVSKILDK